MRTMCQACGSEQTKLGIGGHCKICNHSFCQECEKSDNPSFLNGGHQDWCCKYCMDKYGREALIPDGMNLNTTNLNATLLSPALSLSSYGSCVSSNGDISAEVNSKIRVDGDDVLDTIKKHPDLEFSAHLEEQGDGSLFKTTSNQFSDAKISSGGMTLPMSTEEMYSSNSLTIATHRDSNSESIELHNSTLGDVQDDSDGPENAIDSSPSFVSNMDTDPLVWIPPEPEDMEDEMESVAYNDDDDDYSDGTQWGQPSSLSFLNEDHGKSHGYKEERQKAMVEAMNGQFKILTSRFLASEGIPPDGEDVESWLNIVASLSWETALLVKPDASEGRAMDPGSYVKVKCIASGARHQSQVIKGLVFKKSTAHKHMPTKFRNPRLLLLQGALGHSAAGLSSFDSMVAEKDYLKSIIEMIEACHPNVVLVEKSVSRDIQESLLEKGITLFFDMKLPRLERIARCTGSKIISSADNLMRPKLRQCDSFHIEKFVEEHNSAGDGGKRPTKTLMFLEGCPKPLGCTILLKGAHSEELKKVKRVMHYTVFAAYHLILETSFFADQRAFFMDMSTVREGNGTSIDKRVPVVSYGATPDLITSDPEGSEAGAAPQKHALDILISDGTFEKSVHEVMQFNSIHDTQGSSLSPVFGSDINSPGDIIMHNNQFCVKHNYEMCQSAASVQPLLPGQLLSSVSASLKKFLGDSLPPRSSESMSSYTSFKEKVLVGQNIDVPVSLPRDAPDNEQEISEKSNQEPDVGTHMTGFESDLTEAIEQCSNGVSNKVQIQNKDEIESVLDPQSILVLFSSQCITKQIVCEQSHLSRIKYYGNFDTSLGRFLRDILLNQKHCCSSCGEPPESHVYWYTHQHGNLTVLVRRLPRESSLPGEAEGKIWMWTRCLKCERESGIPRSTRRVVMSSAARGLSFGKFLELSFSSHSANNRLSRCGHSLHRDSLRFFGLGSNVAMFRYSSVEIYDVCMPPPVLEFYSPTGHEWLKKEARDVFVKGDLFFTEVANILQKLKPRFSRSLLEKFMKLSYSVKEFCDVGEMLMQEKAEFEDFLMKAINRCGQLGDEILGIHWLKQELLLELYIWDRRLHSIMSCTKEADTSDDAINEQRSCSENDTSHDKYVEESLTENGGSILEAPNQIPVDPVESSSCGNHQGQKLTILETGLGIESAGSSGNTISKNHDSFEVDITEVGCLTRENSAPSMTEEHIVSVIDQDNYVRSSSISSPLSNKDCEEESIPILDHIQEDHSIPVTTENLIYVEGVSNLEPQTDKACRVDEVSSKEQHPNGHVCQELHDSKLEDPEGWIWAPFSQLRSACRKDLHGGFLQKFEFINSYTPSYLSPMHQLITDGTDSLHFPIGPGGNVMSISGDDISSIIACALALSEDPYGLTNYTIEKEGEGKGEADNSCTLTMDGSVPSSYWSSIGSSEYEGIRASQIFSSFSSDELSTSGSDGLFVDRLIASEDRHPEIPVGSTKVAGKSKYSVICIHAKQFYALRRRCCPSEMAYISSLSRCKKWDAQGGKSKAFFAKSMDDRFIIKQIKKTELDSFLKFAPDYFKHISLSLDSGSQTCLAKILGIYQVRQNKSGKEVKIDLMVMENLLFGRNISRTYDLKGAVFSRYVKDSNDPDKVLLDQNLVEDMRISPIYIGGKTKHLLQRAIWNDTSFLTSINVMDYSLLVGVDRQRRELVFGIIDYLRQYTWDKQLETWVKASLVVPRNSLPTVISPKEYKKRFRKFMTKYFLTVPDSWSSERCSGPCKFCIGGCSSSKIHNAILPEKSIEACA